jgi:hypothetical protein
MIRRREFCRAVASSVPLLAAGCVETSSGPTGSGTERPSPSSPSGTDSAVKPSTSTSTDALSESVDIGRSLDIRNASPDAVTVHLSVVNTRGEEVFSDAITVDAQADAREVYWTNEAGEYVVEAGLSGTQTHAHRWVACGLNIDLTILVDTDGDLTFSQQHMDPGTESSETPPDSC